MRNADRKNGILAQAIFINDSLQYVVVGTDKQAEEKMRELKKAHWERFKVHRAKYADYNDQFYWNIRSCDWSKP